VDAIGQYIDICKNLPLEYIRRPVMGVIGTILVIPFIFLALYMLGVKSGSLAYNVVIGAVILYLAWILGLRDIVMDVEKGQPRR